MKRFISSLTVSACFLLSLILFSGCDKESNKPIFPISGSGNSIDNDDTDTGDGGNDDNAVLGNDYPIVLLHGFMGWGRDELAGPYGHYYWGGYDDLQEILKSAGHDCYTAAVGPFSSNWDRACELYAQLKGTRVDYGVAHSAKFGHSRFGRDYTGKALIPDWGGTGVNRKIHLIAHSQGGVTARVFAQLLVQGSSDERNADYAGQQQISPLFTGSSETKNLISSITTMTAIHNGGTMILGLEKLAPSVFENLIITLIETMGLDTSGTANKIFDFKLEQFGITSRQSGEKITDYFARINGAIDTFINENQKDISFWDDSPEGAREQNAWVHAQDTIYYFSYAGLATHPSNCSLMRDNGEYYHLPDADMIFIFDAFAMITGSYTCNDARYTGLLRAKDGDFYNMPLADRVVIDSSWWPNDGMASTITQKGPWVYPDNYAGKKDVIVDWDGTTIPGKGVWNYFGVLQGFDHFDAVGFEILPAQKDDHPGDVIGHIEDWYVEQADFLKALPR